MKKISRKTLIQISVVLLVILLGIFSFYIQKNTENKQQESSTDTKISSGPRGGQPDAENILVLTPPNTRSTSDAKNILVSVSPDIKNIPDTEKIFVSPTTENSVIQTDSISLIAGDTNVKLKITSGQTLYEVLQNEENKKLISFTGKKYTGIGFFVTDIGNLHQGDGKYLMYYINGIEASSGISDYVPKNGDIVEWKLK